MQKRFLSIWFPYLKMDWLTRRRPSLEHIPFVLALPDHGRMMITEANIQAQKSGINTGMVLADARAIYPLLQYLHDNPSPSGKLLHRIAEWCIRYSPWVVVDPPDGLLLDVTGCTQLWGGEANYITSINTRFKKCGYHTRTGMADTIGTAWAISHFGTEKNIIEPCQQKQALTELSAAALRLPADITDRLYRLGLREIGNFISMPRSALRRRFGDLFIQRLQQALGEEEEITQPVCLPEAWQERLPCIDPVTTRTGIEMALQTGLQNLCTRLQHEQKGIRIACLTCYRVDGKTQQISIGTNRASANVRHLFKLFELKLETIDPGLGIELFIVEAKKAEDVPSLQENLWDDQCTIDHPKFGELMDRINGKIGFGHIHRYLPNEHYWPERSIKESTPFYEQPTTEWKIDRPRPIQLLSTPEPIQVTAPIPDYPPMLFRYKGKLHIIKKADGPERIEQEWWLQEGPHRDYYAVEDAEGQRYWLYRSGHYGENQQWYLHGFFA